MEFNANIITGACSSAGWAKITIRENRRLLLLSTSLILSLRKNSCAGTKAPQAKCAADRKNYREGKYWHDQSHVSYQMKEPQQGRASCIGQQFYNELNFIPNIKQCDKVLSERESL